MTIRRQLVNIGSRNTDYRVGPGAFQELDRFVAGAVGRPKRAVLLTQAEEGDAVLELVRRALVDAGFSVFPVAPPEGERASSVRAAAAVLEELERVGATADDALIGLGDARLCSLASFCARVWCGGCACVLLPTTLDAMVSCATSMTMLDVGASREMASVEPFPAMVVCDTDLVLGEGVDAEACGLKLGLVEMLVGAMAGGRSTWARFGKAVPALRDGIAEAYVDELACAQQTRRTVRGASNPSARSALEYGSTTARALAACLPAGTPGWQLLAEGVRFESRLAVDAGKLEVDTVFEQDDRLEELGVPELAFSLDVDAFVAALKDARFKRANRFLIALPRHVGTIRLTSVDDDLLREHAEAYLASRAALVEG